MKYVYLYENKYLMEVEDEVKFTNITKIFIKNLHKTLHKFKNNKLIFILIHNGYKIETSVSFVNDLVLFVVKKITHFWITCYD